MAAADQAAIDPHAAEDAAARRLIRRTLKQWPLILACALVAGVAGYIASSSRTEQFEATTTLQLNEVDYSAVLLGQNLQQQGQDAQTKAATNAKLVTMPMVRDAAALKLAGRADTADLKDAITVTTEPDTTLIAITARSPDPKLAADMANATREIFIEQRRQVATRQAVNARDSMQRQLEGMSEAERMSVAGQAMQQRLATLGSIVDTAGSGVSTADPAQVPAAAVSPNPKRDAILAMIAGGLLGLGVALLRARLDDHVREVDELSEYWDLPVLGSIPETKEVVDTGRSAPGGAALEAFALTRTNLRYLHVEGDVRSLVVTSAISAEGKSTVTWNLAIASAMAESRVLVIDADLRRPVLTDRLGLPAGKGLSEVLAGMAEFADVIKSVQVDSPGGETLTIDVMPAGFVPPSPIPLLERESAGTMIEQLATMYDLVLIDTPPATVVADAKILLEHADAAIVVSRLGRVTRPALLALRELLSDLSTPVLGVVINSGVRANAYGYDGYAPYASKPSTPTAPTSGAPAPSISKTAAKPAPATPAAETPAPAKPTA